MEMDAVARDARAEESPCRQMHADEKDYRGQVSMDAGGSVNMEDPGYVENDDVKSSMAEGYF